MLFAEVNGHKELKEQLARAVTNNNLGHAILFYGPEGNNALLLAWALAQYLNCENKGADSCNNCNSCKKFNKLIHPDFHFVYPIYVSKADKKFLSVDFLVDWRKILLEQQNFNLNQWFSSINADNKNANIPAAECNEIIRKVQLKAFEADYKIVVIWQAEYLSKEGNKLLKIIEEPPNNTIFILIANDVEQILPTIQSRTRLIKVPSLTNAEMQTFLERKETFNKQQIDQIINIAEGSLIEAKILIANEGNNFNELMIRWYEAAFKNNAIEANNIIDEIQGVGKQNQKYFIEYQLNFLRQTLLYLNTKQNNKLPENEREQKLLKYLANKIDQLTIMDLVELLDKQIYYIERYANIKIQFFNLFIELSDIIRRVAVVSKQFLTTSNGNNRI